MRNRETRLLGVALIALFAAFSAGCVDPETGPVGTGGSGSSAGSGGKGGEAGQGGQAGSGGDTGQGGDTGGSGAGGNMSFESPMSSGWVSAGGVSQSGSYRMVFTFGEPFDQGNSSSSSYRIQSGLVGAVGSNQ